MMHAFLSGELIRDPERKTAANGNAYVVALLRVGEELVSVTAFDPELCARLAELKKGEALSVSGRLQARPYTDKEGNPRVGLSVTATEMMSAPGRRTTAAPRARPRRPAQPAEAAPPFDDELNF